jgi:membrane-associated phospholipid phosphatase
MKKLAWVVSRIFDPVIEIPLVLSVAVWWALTNGLRWRFLVFLMVMDALLPALYMLWGLKKGFISDWDITKKQERRGLYVVTALTHLVGVVYAFFLGKTELGYILLVFWSLAVVFAVITYFWKISVHAGVNGVMLAFFNHFWGWENYWWLVLVLLLVLWSRVEIKKHSWLQVMVGSGLAIAWVELGLSWLV